MFRRLPTPCLSALTIDGTGVRGARRATGGSGDLLEWACRGLLLLTEMRSSIANRQLAGTTAQELRLKPVLVKSAEKRPA
jgi:hypothetical protein